MGNFESKGGGNPERRGGSPEKGGSGGDLTTSQMDLIEALSVLQQRTGGKIPRRLFACANAIEASNIDPDVAAKVLNFVAQH